MSPVLRVYKISPFFLLTRKKKSWFILRAIPNFSIFCLCSFRSSRTFFNPSSLEKAGHTVLPKDLFSDIFLNRFTSAPHVEERVKIVENECTLGPQSYPSSLRPNLRLSGPGIPCRTGHAQGNTNSVVCIQYELFDQDLQGAGPWSRVAYHLGRAELTSTSPHTSGKTHIYRILVVF